MHQLFCDNESYKSCETPPCHQTKTELKTTGVATCRLTDREALVNEVEGQLKKLAITASNRKDHVFLSINTNRQGFISKENLRALVSHHHLPADPDIIEGVRILTALFNSIFPNAIFPHQNLNYYVKDINTNEKGLSIFGGKADPMYLSNLWGQ